jgi:hypothetical protein
MRTRVARRCALSTLAALAALVVVGPSPAAAGTDTFSGTCRDLEGYTYFPDQPLTNNQVDSVMTASLSGGECSGTLNGKNVQSTRNGITVKIFGSDSCGLAIMSGRFNFTVAGHTISGVMTYRRVLNRTTVLWQGDNGGQAVVDLHPLLAVVQGTPLDDAPVVGPFVSGPTTGVEAVEACAGAGITKQAIHEDLLATLPSFSG